MMLPENPDPRPVARLARQLLAAAEACPALISRSENSIRMTKAHAGGSFPAIALLSDPAFDFRQYLQDLVSRVEPVRVEPDLDPQGLEEVPACAEDPYGEAVLDHGFGVVPPRSWPGWAAGMAALAVHLVAVAALLGVYGYNTAVPGPDVAAVVRTHMPGTERIAAISPPPTFPAGLAKRTTAPDSSGDNAASPEAVPRAWTPAPVTGTTPSLPPAASPSHVLPNTVQQADMSEQEPPRPALPDRRARGWDARGSDQRDNVTTALTRAPLTKLEAQIAHNTSDVAVPALKRAKLQSQIDNSPNKLAEATRRRAELPERVAQTESPIVAPYHATPTSAHQVLRRWRYRELPAMLPRTATRESPPSPKQQLLSARKALADNDSLEARGLLEAAQTSIVFSARNASPERASIATRQITDALSMLNSGDTVSAQTYLDRAITTMQPAS